MEGQVFFFTSVTLVLLAIMCMRPKAQQMINPPQKAKTMSIEEHLSKLGCKCKDKVSGVTGVITHVGFDLFGCIQVIVHPGVDEKGDPKDTVWFDINRLEITESEPVMKAPNFFGNSPQALGLQGPCEKPRYNKV